MDAIWFAHANNQSELVQLRIKPFLDAAVQELINGLSGPGGVIALFERHSSRLMFVRQDKLEKRLLEDEFDDGADADLYSDTTRYTPQLPSLWKSIWVLVVSAEDVFHGIFFHIRNIRGKM